MAGKDTISISFAIKDGKDGLKNLIADADGLRKVMEENVKASSQMLDKKINLAAGGIQTWFFHT